MSGYARLSLLSLACFVALAATGCSPAQQIVGKWDMDTAKAMSTQVEGLDPKLAALMPFLQFKVQITFEGDGNYAVTGSFGDTSVKKAGSWRYVKMDGKAMVLMVKEAGKTDENELRITLTDVDHAEISMPLPIPGQKDAMPFVRVKPAS